MSSFYASRKSFDVSDRSSSHDPASNDTVMQRPASASGHHSNASSASLGSGGAPMHAMMVPGNVVPTLERPDSNSPFSDWEAYIVKQAQDWSDKRAHTAASPSPQLRKNSGPRIVWADQIRKSSPQTQPLVYTKARDRFAPPISPQESSPPTNSRSLLRRPSFDKLRPSFDGSRASLPSQPVSHRPSISSPIMTRSILTTAQPDSVEPWSGTLETHSAAPFARASPDPLQVPQNESQASSVCSLSPLPLSLSGDDFSSLLLSNFAKRGSTSSTSSGRAPGPCELIAEPLPALLSSETSKPPSIASTYSMQSRRASWASSIDLDPALICTPPLSSEGSQEQSRSDRPAFLAEYGLDHDTEESDTECSHYADKHEEFAAMPSFDMGSPQTPKDHELPPQPVFQRLEADLISLHENDNGNTQRFTPDGRPLPLLDLSSLPREKQDTVRMARARLLSPTSFKKAFSLRSKGSHSGSRSSDSSPSLNNSSSEEVGKISESAVQTPTVASMRGRLPSLVAEDMTQWAAGVPREAPPASLLDGSNSTMSHAPSMQMSPSLDSFAHTMSSAGSSAETPLSPAFSYSGASILSESSRSGRPSSVNSSGQRKHRVGTPGLTKKTGSDTGATASLDPHLARSQTRARSGGSVSSHTPSTSSAHRRGSRKSGRSRITDGMPSFADMASTLAVPVSNQRRFSTRSFSSEGSIDSHSNASNGSSFAKVGGSSDDGSPAGGVASTTPVVKSVLRKRVPSLDGSLLSPRKEVSFELPVSAGFGTVEEALDEEEEELLEHEQRQRSHLVLPPMKLQAKQSANEEDASGADTASRKQATRDDLDVARFLETFGRDIKSVESLELLDDVHSGSCEWPKREDWDSMPAYLAAYATTFLSRFADDSATLVYSDERAPAQTAGKTVSAPLLSSHPVYTSMVRSVLRIASWEQPLVSAGVSSFYALSLAKGKLAVVLAVGLALLAATGAAQSSPTSSSEAEELQEAYSKIASVLLGSAQTHERMRNLALWRSPKASLRFTGLLLALCVGATRFASGLMSLPGLFIGLAVFVWLPAILNQPEWAPTWLKQGNPVDVLLYDVPTDAQHAILTLRRRAASGEQLVHRPNDMGALSTTKFDHRVSASELQHAGDVVDGAYFAKHEGEAGHVVVLAHRVIFRALGKSERVVTLSEELERDASTRGCKITFDSRLEKIVRLDKTEAGLEVRLKNGTKVVFDDMVGRDEAFARLVALAPQKWH